MHQDGAKAAPLAFQDIEPTDRLEVGGKAAGLARLARAGLPVPPGFVVPAACFVEALQAVGLWTRALALAERVDATEASALRAAIARMELPPALQHGLALRAARLGPRVAVRSSAIDEDGLERSYAGQYATRLNVPVGDLADAIRHCWASLYSEPALAYRKHGGPRPGSMGVVVQAMVEPHVAGVLFTVNPLNGSWREMVVEATYGLGEALVSGRIAPHWYLVRRPRRAPRSVERALARVRLSVVQRDLPEIPVALRCGPQGEVVETALPPEVRSRSALDDGALFRLCRLGLRAERHLGGPQDVEWAIDGRGHAFLLQSRPITSGATPRARKDVLWTRRFIGERWPEPATPLGWSLMQPVLDWFIAYPEMQQRHLGGGPALRLVRSRPYVNGTVFRHLAFKFPGAPAPTFLLELIPPEEADTWARRFAVMPDLGVYGSIILDTLRKRRWQRFRWNPFTNPDAWDEVDAGLRRDLPALLRDPISERDALVLAEGLLDLVRRYVGVHICSLLFANIWDQVVDAFLAAWIPDEATTLMDALATCPPGNLTLACNEALWKVASVASEEELARLERRQLPAEGSPFGEALSSFLKEYGYRSEASWEIFTPRWRDEPWRLVPLLRVQRSGRARDPSEDARRQGAAYEAAIERVRERLGPGLRLQSAERMIGLLRRYLLLRENQRFTFDRLLYATQRTCRWLGARFVEKGWLQVPGDVDYLTWDEVKGLVEATFPPNEAARLAAERRLVREADRLVEPPIFLRGDEAVTAEPAGTKLPGLGISPGRARGRVRIVRSLAEGHRLLPGEVLVTRSVDPAWTPLFLSASAVILEMGGRLSHGAVVAREYRVPAVVNVEGAMRRLVDGAEVTVDGTRGVVWVHEVDPRALD